MAVRLACGDESQERFATFLLRALQLLQATVAFMVHQGVVTLQDGSNRLPPEAIAVSDAENDLENDVFSGIDIARS